MFQQCNVTIMVADMERSIHFYTDALGLPLGFRAGNEWAQIEAPGLTIGLHPVREPAAAPPDGRISIGFGVQDLAATIASLRQNGVAIADLGDVEPGRDRLVHFADPDGTPLYLIEVR